MGKAKINYLIIGLILFRVAYEFSPFVAYFSPRGLNMISVVSLYLLVGNSFGVDNVIRIFFKYLPIFLVSVLAIIFSTVKLSMSIWVQIYQIFQDILWVLLIKYVISLNNIKLNKILLFYVLGFLVFTSLTTYYGCLKYPRLSRDMTAGVLTDSERVLFASLNIGNFSFIYTVVLTIPLIIYLYKTKFIRLVFLVLLLFPLIMGIYQAEFTTALITAMIGMTAMFFPKFTNRRKFIRMSFLLGVLLIVFSTYLTDFLYWLSGVVGSDIMAERFSDTADIALGQATSNNSDASARLELWTTSLEHFWQNPLFGVGDNGGGHSWLFDNMSMFGIFGLIACVVVYISLYKHAIKPYQNSSYYYFGLFVLILQIILSIVNTGIFFNVFIICIPLIYYSCPPVSISKDISEQV